MRLLAALLIVMLAGCATSETRKAEVDASAQIANARSLEATARIKEAEANAVLFGKLDIGGATAIALVDKVKGLGFGQVSNARDGGFQQTQVPSLLGLAWQSVLQIADIGLRAYGIKSNRDINLTQSNNNRDVALSTNATFSGMGQAIAAAGTAGYPFVQAPGAVSITNNSLSGTGVLGSGTYTAPITTNTTTDSHNNPAPTVVTCVGTPPVCTR